MTQATPTMQAYFSTIQQTVEQAYTLAEQARKQGHDPEPTIDMPLARNMAERVEGLLRAVAPQLKGISIRIHELEEIHGKLDWRVALAISLEVAQEAFCTFENKIEAVEIGLRTGIAYLTLGVVASPLEGFTGLQIKKRKDGENYLSLSFSGPIRSAGGTAAAVSLVLADYLRIKMGYKPYDPTEQEVKRMVTEIYDYHERITNLQYLPTGEEITFLIKHLPIQVDGSPSENIEVSNYKDLDRIETNRIRNGICLVLAEGLAQKAPKLEKQLSTWGKEFDLSHWGFLTEFVALQKKLKAGGTKQEHTDTITPDYTYIKDLVAGRPVLTYPMRAGGFRLRYGRGRTTGYSAAGIHPATTMVLKEYIAIGTQLKVERPGKAAAVSTIDTIEGPVIKLTNGDVIKINTVEEANQHKKEIDQILFLGDILFNYGDFYNRAHTLIPPGYCEEWWAEELRKVAPDAKKYLDNPLLTKPSAEESVILSKQYKIPLHPLYTHHYRFMTSQELKQFLALLHKANYGDTITLPHDDVIKNALESIGIPHKHVLGEHIVFQKPESTILQALFPKAVLETKLSILDLQQPTLDLINSVSTITIRDKSGHFIGARMGRPEKAKMRKLTGSPHVLFPVGEEGGRLRSFQAAMERGTILADFPQRHCIRCNTETIYAICEKCGEQTEQRYNCNDCKVIQNDSCRHGPTRTFSRRSIDISHYFRTATNNLNLRVWPDIIKGVRGTSNREHIPENLIKGIIRAKHDLCVNKDGTVRYDMTQMPLTHFKPRETGTSLEKLHQLGYNKDIHGKPLTALDQIIELKPQDLILPCNPGSTEDGADKVLLKCTKFCDELLTTFYKLPPYYNISSSAELVGKLLVLLAPHTSAGIVGRIIGFSQTQVFYAHPYLHAATRRDCDGDECSVTLLMDAFLNFSRKFLPNTLGATQDAPLVLTSSIVPSEVDDMVFDIDISSTYGLDFYEACLTYAKPWEVAIPLIGNVLNTPLQYEGMLFTHDTTSIDLGAKCSSYKTIPSMEEKLLGQMELAEKIRAVDKEDVARLVIEKHFLRDIKGNLRKFSQQQFRCVTCNEKFRRPPLLGRCECGGRIIFTISEGSIVKYLQPSLSIATKYDLPPYLKQTLELTQHRIEQVFGRDKERQEGLGKWFG